MIEEETKKVEEIIEKDDSEKTIDNLPGVGEKIAEKLRNAGYTDLMAIAVTPQSILMEETNLGDTTCRKIIQASRKELKMGFMSGAELQKKRLEVGKITFTSENLNKLLGGGAETQAITEFYGGFGSGKTQIGLQLAVNVQLPKSKGGLNGCAVFIDTENTFRPKRIEMMAEAAGLNPKKVLENIKIARAFSSDHQMLLTEKIPELIKSGFNVKLVVIDSLMGLFRAEYIGRGTLAARQQKLNRYLHQLQRLTDRFNLAVYITNQVMSKPDIFFGDPTQAIGGHILAHASTFRVYLRKSKGERRVAKMVDSPCLPEGEAVFHVTDQGIQDGE
ncbi:MAG: DNA repair and recombination protein RadA [Nanoarchaeota archaeon]|nr:DNA repair and recombination protein RadA [Nanoarchaeota archaeon]